MHPSDEDFEKLATELEERAERKVDARDARRDKDTSLQGQKTHARIDGEAYGLRAAARSLRAALAQQDEDWHYGAIRMGRRWYSKRFIPGGPENDGDLPDCDGVEFWEDGEWKPYSIATFQERERAAGLLGNSAQQEGGVGEAARLAEWARAQAELERKQERGASLAEVQDAHREQARLFDRVAAVFSAGIWFERNEHGRLEELRSGDEPSDAIRLFSEQPATALPVPAEQLCQRFASDEFQEAIRQPALECDDAQEIAVRIQRIVLDTLAAPTQHEQPRSVELCGCGSGEPGTWVRDDDVVFCDACKESDRSGLAWYRVPTRQPEHVREGDGEPYTDLSYRERVICAERDRGISREKLAERFEVSPERIAQLENGARQKLANLPLTGERFETLIDRTIRLARSSDRPDLAIRAEVLTPFRVVAAPAPEPTSGGEER